MSVDIVENLFSNADRDKDGNLSLPEFRELITNSDGNVGQFVTSNIGLNSAYTATDNYDSGAPVDMSSYQNSSFSNPIGGTPYPVDAAGRFLDPTPTITHVRRKDCPETQIQNIRLRYLIPPKLAPHGGLTIQQVRPKQPPAPDPIIEHQREPERPQPPPLVFRQRPPAIPPQKGPETRIVRVPNPPVPPPSVILHKYLAPPARPRDINIELWRAYTPRGPGGVKVIPAGPAKPYEPPRNKIFIYQCPPVNILRQIQRLGDLPMDPETYNQQYRNSLLTGAEIQEKLRLEQIPPGILAQIDFTAEQTNTVTYGEEFSDFSSSANLKNESTVGDASYFTSSDQASGESLSTSVDDNGITTGTNIIRFQ